jgi:FkbM family methyltransferase
MDLSSTIVPTSTLRTELFRRLAQISRHAPRGRTRLAIFFLKLASNSNATPSLYGPWLQTKWHDLTFRFCASGYYGDYLSNFLREFSYPYSFVDIGANYGIYSLVAAANFHCKNCYAFEPNADVFEALKTNIELNKAAQIQAFNFAFSDQAGFFPFTVSEAHSGAGKLSTGEHSDQRVQTRDKAVFDNIESAENFPKVVKIDVEGHEPVVIHELMKSTLWKSVRYLYFEANPDRFDVGRLAKELEVHGFKNTFCAPQGIDPNLMFERQR